MSRSRQITQFPALDHEPRKNGPLAPPANCSSSAILGEDNGSILWSQSRPSHSSRASSELGISTVQFSTAGPAIPLQKVYAERATPRPAGSIPQSSRAPSALSSAYKSKASLEEPMKRKIKRNRLQEWRESCSCAKFFALLALLLIIAAVILIIVLTQVLKTPSKATFEWTAPVELTNGQNSTSTVEMTVKDERVRFQMTGAAPMKSNFITYYDFNKNQVITIDQALQLNGKNLYCFVYPLDRSSMQSVNHVRKAAKNPKKEQTNGWQEEWNWIPAPVQNMGFEPPINECNGSRIVQLQQSNDQKNRRCTDCYDFCLPSYGIMRDGNKDYLNIVRRECFYLFVPEWRQYAQANSIEQNQQDFENYYRTRQHMQVAYSGTSGRWINISGANRVDQQQQPQPQQAYNPNQQFVYPTNSPPAEQGYHPAVNGVVNLNGVNANNPRVEYNRNSPQSQSNSAYASVPEIRRQEPAVPVVQNGFGANPNYMTNKFGFNENNQGQMSMGNRVQIGQPQPQPQQQQQNQNFAPNQPRMETQLNEFGNPVPRQQPVLPDYRSIQATMGHAIPGQYGANLPDRVLQTLNQQAFNNNNNNAGSVQEPNYRANVEPINYNIPNYNQPLRPDALSRHGRVY